ncbi:MAG TPA: PPC domain-containing DNA-binding protein [Bryobacteraceae bacterium]|nr:PPC domain-containing DNA-binding protein [Bryobacteraceae bacterium]
MRTKVIAEGTEKTYALILEKDEEAAAKLLEFAKKNKITAAHFTAIGGFSRAVLGYFDIEKKDYLRIPVDDQVEVVSLVGDVATEKEQPKVHAHVVLGKRDGTTRGGHLLEGHVRPTLEVVLAVSPAHLKREFDAESGIALIK